MPRRRPFLRPVHAHPAPFETVNQLLDAIKARHTLPSERKLAQHMEWDQSQLRNYRKGRSSPNNVAALEIARELDIDEGMVLLICHAEREQDAHTKKVWLYMASTLSKLTAAALAVGFVAIASTPTSSRAAESSAQQCIFCQIQLLLLLAMLLTRRAHDRRRVLPAASSARLIERRHRRERRRGSGHGSQIVARSA
jgi:hypothetical protein